ncbi:glucosaminidase domain and LysM peptidoglycan-binding domain-containing protein [Pedobacter punctiformis]|uniref:Peptidoglycan hydrolase n=1 Tax=Pedobacter punctiformis TaxID=3004097 RepID=A0ABT4L5R6_9SPHI|nr:glucosaminidase domain-containing protein [Pedobacter sp. HCMS5-2]MCZ4243265.1 glucosaminidase domain-containing protein [Pedobacter sp. HCMS5-2]
MKLFTFCLLLLSGIIAKAQNTEDYIAEHVEYAQGLMRDHKIPASLILAVAIHESASGNSRIAQHLNNHFGVKGPNNNTEIRSAYRDYSNADESYSHFVEIMETRAPFNNLFSKYDQYDYKGWAKGIQRCGYAHSRTWSSQVIALIKKYELYQYDERPAGYEEPVYTSTVSHHKKSTVSKNRKSTSNYTVKSGDNLSVIAKKKGTTVKKLMQKNGLKKASLKPGQKIKV